MFLFFFFVSMVPSSISPTRYQKTNFEGGGRGGDKGVQGYQCRQQTYKHHQEYIQSLMKFHLPRMLDINLAANIN